MLNYNETMKQLAEYKRLQEETSAIIDALQDELKEYMETNNLEILTGNEHKATYKAVTSSRLDSTALKKDLPDIAAQYTKQTQTKRFLFK